MRELHFTEPRECYAWAEQQGFWSNGRNPKGRTEVAHYDYTDEDGELLYQKVRYEPKFFCLRRSDGNGGWIYKNVLKGVRRVVYRLPEAVETISMGRTIYLFEGEKDVDNSWKIGIPATCNYDGGGKWNDEQTKTFDGADVVAITDNDETGHKHGNIVITKLSGVAKKVRVFAMAALWPQCPPKGDVSTSIEKTNGTAEQFYALIAQAKPEPTPADDEAPPYSEEALALLFAARHSPDFRYLPAHGRWITWTPTQWHEDEITLAYDLARAVVREQACPLWDPLR